MGLSFEEMLLSIILTDKKYKQKHWTHWYVYYDKKDKEFKDQDGEYDHICYYNEYNDGWIEV